MGLPALVWTQINHESRNHQGYHIFVGVVIGGLTGNNWPRSFNFFIKGENLETIHYFDEGPADRKEGFAATIIYF